MSFNISLPRDWIDIKIDNKILFINLKENLVSYYPPMDLKNIGAFLNFYNINTKKEDFIKILQRSTNSKEIIKSNHEENKKKGQLSNGLSMDIDSQDLKTVKQPFDRRPITDENKLKILNGLLDADQSISIILKQAVLEKYNTLPNYEYEVDIDGKTKKSNFKCFIKIREEHRLCTGASNVSKNKAKEEAIKEGLKILVPEIFKKIKSDSKSTDSSKFSNENLKYPTEKEDTFSVSLDTLSDDNLKKSYVHKDRHNGGDSDNSNLYSSEEPVSNSSQDFNFKNSECLVYEGIINEKKFLSQKRKKNFSHEEYQDKVDHHKFKKEVKKKKRSDSYEDFFSDEDGDIEYVFGGCLNEDVFANLSIDDPLVVDKYLKTSNFTPLNILHTFKTHYPRIDVKERTFSRNDGIKFDMIENNSYTKIVLESNKLNIRVECSHDNKKLAREYCAQKFLYKVYSRKFSKWVDLVKYYEEKRFIIDPFLK